MYTYAIYGTVNIYIQGYMLHGDPLNLLYPGSLFIELLPRPPVRTSIMSLLLIVRPWVTVFVN